MTRLYTEPHYRIAGDDWTLNEIKIIKRSLVEITFVNNINFNIYHFEMSIWDNNTHGDNRLMWEIDTHKDETFNTRSDYYAYLRNCFHSISGYKTKNIVDTTYHFLDFITVWYSEE